MRHIRDYIPPRGEGDPLQPESVIPLLEAIAKHTDRFHKLRESVYPLFADNPRGAEWVAALDEWIADLDLWASDPEAQHRLTGWLDSLFYYWRNHPKHRDAEPPRVDQGYFDCDVRVFNPLPDLRLVLPQFNEDAEPWSEYEARMRASFDRILQNQKAAFEQRKAQFGMTEAKPRKRAAGPSDSYTMFVLHKYRGWSFGKIANSPIRFTPGAQKLSRQAVEKRVRTLANSLGLST